MQQLIVTMPYKPQVTQGIKYFSVAAVALAVGGAAVYLYMKKNNN